MTDQPTPDLNGSTPVHPAICAFLVVVLPDGSSQVILDTSQRFQADRPATPKDVYPALANAVADWQAMKTAEAVMAYGQQMAQQATFQQQMEQVRANMRRPGA